MVVLYNGVSELAPVQGALRGMGAVTAGLITATGLKLLPAVRTNPLGRGLCWLVAALSFGAIALLHIPLVWVLLALGGLSCVAAYRGLQRIQQLQKTRAAP
jgi:chromate transporter